MSPPAARLAMGEARRSSPPVRLTRHRRTIIGPRVDGTAPTVNVVDSRLQLSFGTQGTLAASLEDESGSPLTLHDDHGSSLSEVTCTPTIATTGS